MNFVAIDVETANYSSASICQIGLVRYRDGVAVEEWMTLVNPEGRFHAANIGIHGITPAMVQDAPAFPDVAEQLRGFLEDAFVISHTYFDRSAVGGALHRYGLEPLRATWLDSTLLARRAWEQFRRRGYGLKNLCTHLGYEFKHHDALEDARAAGFVTICACSALGMAVSQAAVTIFRK